MYLLLLKTKAGWFIFQNISVVFIYVSVVTTFFRSPFSDQSTAVQTRQPVFVQLLQIAFRLSQCAWLSASQRHNVESCIRILSDMARSRRIAIPSDMGNQVTSLFNIPALHLGASKARKIFRSSRLREALNSHSSVENLTSRS